MRILFVQPRYHTNYHSALKALIDGGHNIKIVTQYRYVGEHYDVIEPTVIGRSSLFKYFEAVLKQIYSEYDQTHTINYALPPVRKLQRIVADFQPDIVILRDYSVYSAFSMLISYLQGVPVIYYDQLPIYNCPTGTRKHVTDAVHNILWGREPVRITPVLGEKADGQRDQNARYIPFVMEPAQEAFERTYLSGDSIQIISIGKYKSERKNHLLLLEAVEELSNKYDIDLTFFGHLENESDPNYLSILKYIQNEGLDDIVTLRKNVPYQVVQKSYMEHDVFVLPSSDEPAAISHLEAMAHGLPVICSDTNGTRCYIAEGENGYVFRSDDTQDLKSKIESIISDPERISSMGERSLEIVQSDHSPTMYRQKLFKAISEAIEGS